MIGVRFADELEKQKKPMTAKNERDAVSSDKNKKRD